ncbi:hypothetical protein LguiA_015414 [Lonicera macranthoides]
MDRRFDGAVVPPESTNGGTTARSSPRQLQLNYTCRKVQIKSSKLQPIQCGIYTEPPVIATFTSKNTVDTNLLTNLSIPTPIPLIVKTAPELFPNLYEKPASEQLSTSPPIMARIKVKGRNNGFIPDDIDMAVGSEKFMIKLKTISRLDFNKRRARSISKAHEEFDWCYIDLDGEGDHSKLEEEDKKWGEDQPCHN